MYKIIHSNMTLPLTKNIVNIFILTIYIEPIHTCSEITNHLLPY